MLFEVKEMNKAKAATSSPTPISSESTQNEVNKDGNLRKNEDPPKNNRYLGFYYSLISGSCASLASIFGKTTFDSSVFKEFAHFFPFLDNSEAFSETLGLIIRLIFFGMIFFMNALMWTNFVKSMHHWSSLHATITNSSVNFFLTVTTSFAWTIDI